MAVEANPDAGAADALRSSAEAAEAGGAADDGVAAWRAQLDDQARSGLTEAAMSRSFGDGRAGSVSSSVSSMSEQSDFWDRSARSSVSSWSGTSESGDPPASPGSATAGGLDQPRIKRQSAADQRNGQQNPYLRDLEKMAKQPFSPAEAEVAASFIHPDHIRPIAQASRQDKTAVTFRAAGAATLRRLEQGAAAKPHAIMEKTIKQGSLLDANGEQDPARLRAMQDADLDGFVGHWDGHRLVGLYVAPSEAELEASGDPAKRRLASMLEPAPKGQRCYPVNENRLEESLAPLKAVEDWKTNLFAGDYDMHDLVLLQGRRSQVPSGSRDEKQLIKHMVDRTSLVDPRRPQGKASHAVIQHGSQHNYVAHMRTEEKGEALSAKVAGREFPIALCERGTWSIIHSEQEHDAFYRRHNMTPKSTWKENGGVVLQDTESGTARLRRSSSPSIEPGMPDPPPRRSSR